MDETEPQPATTDASENFALGATHAQTRFANLLVALADDGLVFSVILRLR